jgi:hypothetical protein
LNLNLIQHIWIHLKNFNSNNMECHSIFSFEGNLILRKSIHFFIVSSSMVGHGNVESTFLFFWLDMTKKFYFFQNRAIGGLYMNLLRFLFECWKTILIY